MQPQQDKEGWQQPTPQASGAPYATPPVQPPATQEPDVPLQPVESSAIQSDSALQPDEPKPDIDQPGNTDGFDNDPVTVEDDEPVHWQAQEYIHHEKTVVWFVIFGVVVASLIAIAIWLMQSITFAILVPVMAIALVVYSRRPPRILNYTLSRQGLYINDRLYPFSQFKGFGVIHDGKEYSVMLIPVKRFMPSVSVYFPEEAGEAIVDMLGVRLPMQQLHLDPIDILIHKLRI